MSVDVNLIFNGNAREAVEFYAEVFGIEKNHFMTFGEFPLIQTILFLKKPKI